MAAAKAQAMQAQHQLQRLQSENQLLKASLSMVGTVCAVMQLPMP